MSDASAPPPTAGGAVRSALMWNAANFAVSQVASAAIFFILAAQLPPAVFGVLALAVVMTDLIATQGRSAMTDAIVQAQDFSRPALNAAFWCGMTVCVAASVILVALRDPLAAAFKAPELALVLPPIAIALLVTPALAVMEALIVKDLNFKTLNLRNMTGVIVSGALALAVVFSPAKEWAFVVQRVTQALVSFGFLLAATKWLPGLSASGASLMGFARRAGPIWAVQGLNVASQRVTETLIGLRIGPTELAVVRVAGKFFEILHGSLTSALMAVWLPVLSRLREDRDGARGFFLRVMSLAAMLCIPAQLGLGLVAPEITALFLSDAYADAAVIIGLVSLGALFIPMSFFRAPILVALGRPGIGVQLALLDLVTSAAIIWIFTAYGLHAAYAALVASWFLLNPISGLILCRLAHVRLGDFAHAIRPAYEASAVMAAAVFGARALIGDLPPLLGLALYAGIGAATYAAYIALVHRRSALDNLAYLRVRA